MSLRSMTMAVEDWTNDESTFIGVIKLMLVVVIPAALLLGSIVLVCSYFDSKNPCITLKESEWHCAHTRTIMVPVIVGKVIMEQPRTICDTWEMNGE